MTFGNFQSQVVQNAERPNERWIYRGHADPAWELVTTYARFHARVHGAGTPYDLNRFRRMLEQFIRRASETSGIDYGAYSVFQKIALAQHHGVPTPMLDWSHSPYVATYFAVTDMAGFKEAEIGFCVYAMEIGAISTVAQSGEDEDRFVRDDRQPFRFIDTNSFFSRRIARQAGCFTYHKFNQCLTAWQASSLSPAPQFKKYSISGSRSKITRELALMGLTGGVLFDDLDYIAKDIIQAEIMAAPKEQK